MLYAFLQNKSRLIPATDAAFYLYFLRNVIWNKLVCNPFLSLPFWEAPGCCFLLLDSIAAVITSNSEDGRLPKPKLPCLISWRLMQLWVSFKPTFSSVITVHTPLFVVFRRLGEDFKSTQRLCWIFLPLPFKIRALLSQANFIPLSPARDHSSCRPSEVSSLRGSPPVYFCKLTLKTEMNKML